MSNIATPRKVQVELHYGGLFTPGKLWYTSKEAAQVLGMSQQFVRESFDNQSLMGQEMSSSTGARRVKMIHRDALLVYLMQTANYTPEDFLTNMKKLVANRPKEEMEKLRVWMDEWLGKRKVG